MKKVAITLIVGLFSIGISLAQTESGVVVKPNKSEQVKGPKFKNFNKPAQGESYSLVSSTKMSELKGPEFKNNNKIAASGEEIKVKTYTSKGPAYKFQRFHN